MASPDNLFEENRGLEKQHFGLPSDRVSKKKDVINGTITVAQMNEETLGSVKDVFSSTLMKQIELVEKLVFKDNECQKLKRKFDDVDRNCRKWHDFAIGLQLRVKQLALVLQRQQASMKTLRNKEVITATISTQTTFEHTENIGNVKNTYLKMDSQHPINFPSTNLRTDVIDLTRGEENLAAAAAMRNSIYGILPQSETQTKLKLSSTSTLPAHHLSQNIDLCNVLHQATVSVSQDSNLSTVTVNDTVKPCSTISSMGVTYANFHLVRPTHQVISASTKPNRFALSKMKNCVTSLYPPLPPTPSVRKQKQSTEPPSKPLLKIRKSKDGIELSWDHSRNDCQIKMESYELYVYQHNPSANAASRWKKIGNDSIKAMPLPMACTLSQFSTGSKYYFAVRGRDVYGTHSVFSDPCCSADV